MKVTYLELFPIDGAGTMLNPAYTWITKERSEFCDNIQRAGEVYYMMRGGYVLHSIEVDKITEIEFDGGKASIKYYHNEPYPFSCRFKNKFGKEFAMGSKDFDSIMNDIRKYSRNGIY